MYYNIKIEVLYVSKAPPLLLLHEAILLTLGDKIRREWLRDWN